MTIDELLEKVAREPPRSVALPTNVLPPGRLDEARRRGWMLLTDLFSGATRGEPRIVHFGHVLGPPAPREEVLAWQARFPRYPLPEDLRALVERANGIHLWADLATGRANSGLAPLEEWAPTRVKMYGEDADAGLLEDRYLAISYDADGASFIVLDVDSGKYFLMDVAGPDESCPIGASADELLDWLWRQRIDPGDAVTSAERGRDVNDDDLINAIRARAINPETRVDAKGADGSRLYPPASPEVIALTEQQLGFELHPLLRRIYQEVANGGFGPGYGLAGLAGGHGDVEGESLVARYHALRAAPWPEKLLPLWDWGCAIWSCLDGNDLEGVIVTNDGDSGLTVTDFTIRSWLTAWVQGTNLWNEIFEEGGQEVVFINPFTRKPSVMKGPSRAKGRRMS